MGGLKPLQGTGGVAGGGPTDNTANTASTAKTAKALREQSMKNAPPLGESDLPSMFQPGMMCAGTEAKSFDAPAFDPKDPPDAQILVAGAGIGGGPMARVAEQGFQTKLLEAGPPQRDWFCDVPALHGRASDNTSSVDGYSPPMALLEYFVEHYETQQNNVDLKLHEELGGLLVPRGRGLGGSGNVNANVAVGADRSTLKGLYEQSGRDPRLHPDRMTKFFARAQDPGPLFSFLETLGHVFTAEKKLGKDNFARLSGEKGWQTITRADPKLLLQDKQLLKIVLHIVKFTNNPKNVKIGDILTRLFTLFDSNNDFNQGREGFTLMPVSVTKDGRRASVLDRIKSVLAKRPDTFQVETEAKVHSLIFNKEGNRVEGMRVAKPHPDVLAQRQKIYDLKIAVPDVPADEVAAHNEKIDAELEKLKTLEAEREPVIEVQRASSGYVLSTGAFEDPMVLIRSGYGPKAVLDRLGIEPVGGVYHEAVGKNLKDRREITMAFHAKDEFTLLEGLGLGKNPHDDEAMQVWEKSGRGVYGANGVVASYQFKSDPSQPDSDIFAFFVPTPFRGYVRGYSTDAETYPQTFTAILLDKNGKLINDDSSLMTPDEFEELRSRLGTVEPDPNDPTNMKANINFNFQRPEIGESPPLYSAMLKMKELFQDCDVLVETVPGEPFSELPEDSIGKMLTALETQELFPKHPDDDVRSAMDWFQKMHVPVFDEAGKQIDLTVRREGPKTDVQLDGKPATAEQLEKLTFFGDLPMTPKNLKAQLQREYLIEYQHSQQWGHHANGTTSLGPDPENNVVGADYRVHGVENLWIASAAATPAAVNPGPFIQLYVAGAIGEVAAESVTEQLVHNESSIYGNEKLSPLQVRLPMEMGKKNSFAENLLLTIDRSRGHVGDHAGRLTGPALAALIANHEEAGFSKQEVELAEAVCEQAIENQDPNASMLGMLANLVRQSRRDQSFVLDVKSSIRDVRSYIGRKGSVSNEQVLEILDAIGPPGTQFGASPGEQNVRT